MQEVDNYFASNKSDILKYHNELRNLLNKYQTYNELKTFLYVKNNPIMNILPKFFIGIINDVHIEHEYNYVWQYYMNFNTIVTLNFLSTQIIFLLQNDDTFIVINDIKYPYTKFIDEEHAVFAMNCNGITGYDTLTSFFIKNGFNDPLKVHRKLYKYILKLYNNNYIKYTIPLSYKLAICGNK